MCRAWEQDGPEIELGSSRDRSALRLTPCLCRCGATPYSAGDGSLAGGGDGVGVFGEDAAGEAWCGRREGLEAGGDLGVGDVEGKLAGGDVEGDGVAFVDGGDGAAEESFRCNMPSHEAASSA